MKTLVAAATLSCLLAPALLGADQRAKTEDGKEVILHDDGTWVYAEEKPRDEGPPVKPKDAGVFAKPKGAVVAYKGKKGNFALNLVPGMWKKLPKTNNPVAEVQFAHRDNDASAMVIAERLFIPLDTLKQAAIQNMKAVDGNPAILKEEKRTVNGKEVLALTINVNAQGIPLTFYGYYYSGDEGSIQVVTWAGQNLFQELKPDLEAFLNGFEVTKK